MNITTSLAIAFGILLALSSSGYADPDTGSAFGMVLDEDGTPVGNATVKFHIDAYHDDDGHGSGGHHGNHDDDGDDGGGHHGHHGDDDDHSSGHGHSMFTTLTDESGMYLISDIPSGRGWAMAARIGFGRDFLDVVVEAGVQNRYDFQLGGSHNGHGAHWLELD